LLSVSSDESNVGLTLSCMAHSATYDQRMQHRSGDRGLIEALARADVLIVSGLSDIVPDLASLLLRTVIHHARPATLVVAPVASARWLLQSLSIGANVTFATDELISTDALQVQRAALIAASTMHRTNARTSDN
jgi:fatty acid/phospholipid biosynthesis enzyme